MVSDLGKGGTQRAAINFATGYRNLGHDSRVLTLAPGGVRADILNQSLVHVYTWGSDSPDPFEGWIPELVHIHSHGCELSVIERISQQFSGNDVVYVETNVFSVPQPWEPILDYSFQMSDCGVWNYRKAGGAALKARKVPYPVGSFGSSYKSAEASRSRLGIPQGALVVGRVGQSAARKWSGAYKRVLAELSRDGNLYFVSVNPPVPLKKKLDRLLGERHIHVDQITDDTLLSEIYSSMDCFLHIADQGETFGYVLVEAAVHGVPVVTLSTPWADNAQPEIVINGTTGLVVGKRRNLPKAVRRAMNSSWDKEAMVATVNERFGAAKVCREVLDTVSRDRGGERQICYPAYELYDSANHFARLWDVIPRRLAWILLGSWSWKITSQIRSVLTG